MRRILQWSVLTACLCLTAACSVVDGMRGDSPAAAPATNPEAELLFGYLETLSRLSQSTPSAQAELVEHVRREAELAPTVSNRLRQALVLGLPGHVASDLDAARTTLGELLAAREQMLPAEVDLATVMYADVGSRLALESENERLGRAQGLKGERELQDLNRRLQSQAAENERLRRQLDEALAKLEAVAALERSMAERDTAPKGAPP